MSDKSFGTIAIYGAGGHCASVIDALEAGGRSVCYVIDDDEAKAATRILNIVVRGKLADVSTEDRKRYPIIIAIAKNSIRRDVSILLTEAAMKIEGVHHPTAIISKHAQVHATAQIMAGVIVNAGAIVHQHAVLNSGCIVEHDCVIGEFTHIGPGARLAGRVTIESGGFVATGATVCPFVRIGAWSTLGAGSVALRDIPARSVGVGAPARIIRQES